MGVSWPDVVREATARYETPLYIFASAPIADALVELGALEANLRLPVRHWFSLKTQPVAPVIRWWRDRGWGVEVVSQCELVAALQEGFAADSILINGVGKHAWLPRFSTRGLRVHFDSRREVEALAAHACKVGWRVGIRCHVPDEHDPDEPTFGGQFGMAQAEVAESLELLRLVGLVAESVHFHIGSNVTEPLAYGRSLAAVARLCASVRFSPGFVDCGGGLPVPGEPLHAQGGRPASVDFSAMRRLLGDIPVLFPDAREVWLENGRFVTSRSGVLVVRVLDIKDRSDSRYLICDGGRTNHAIVSDWETHEVSCVPHRDGPTCPTTVCGPTCMAFDRLLRAFLPSDIQVGDYIVWHNAGAYHVSWETRFSHGLATVLWYDDACNILVARAAESPSEWWARWL